MRTRNTATLASIPYHALDQLRQLEELRTSLLLVGFDGSPGALALARTVEHCHRALRRALARYERVLWDAGEEAPSALGAFRPQAPGFAPDASADEATLLPIETAARGRREAGNGDRHA